ncbi:MAG TPA: UDP-2,3-diacylglucosamine diphosphatase [Prolixibacteraceae bacterium]|nr:UDP-2,3-diacylglucosamine diphosphatase [Prolixibacteraceae bacterium]
MKEGKRKVGLVVLSDIHLGTFGCKAKELLRYLKSIDAETLVLNGDIIDVWQFNKHYFPKSHMKVVKHFTSLLSKKKKIYYITGNHDEMLRKFKGFQLGTFEIANQLELNLDGKKAWIFHGDVFDNSVNHTKWLAKLGGLGYNLLILINAIINLFSRLVKGGKISFSKSVKNGVKEALNRRNKFEKIIAGIAVSKGYDYVVCGHVHQPLMHFIANNQGAEVLYLNSGDWIENLTALEYNNQQWSLYEYANDQIAQRIEEALPPEPEEIKVGFKSKEIFGELIEEFQLINAKAC